MLSAQNEGPLQIAAEGNSVMLQGMENELYIPNQVKLISLVDLHYRHNSIIWYVSIRKCYCDFSSRADDPFNSLLFSRSNGNMEEQLSCATLQEQKVNSFPQLSSTKCPDLLS